jgi:formylglycine-generating enzyme required for sulfatase activity
MKPAPPGDTQPLRTAQPPLRLLRWQARTQVFHEELGGGARLTMVRIPAGSFQMGSAEQEPGRHANEGPVHTVTLAEFLIGQTPITQAQWPTVAGWQERPGERWGREMNPEPAKFQGEEARLLAGEMNTDERPVERVSWLDATEFCNRLSQRTGRTYTLPSEAQWEYACRAGTTTPVCFGDTISPELAKFRGNYFYADGPKGPYRDQATSVGMFPANAWGLHDMHGNVWEWCQDEWYKSYEAAPTDGRAWVDGTEGEKIKEPAKTKLLRGGSWDSFPGGCRSAVRYRYPLQPGYANSLVGFRVVCLPQGPSFNP